MKTLLILRHAKSSWKDRSLDDHDRPLNKRGLRTAPRMGELIHIEGLVPDLILTSTAQRACHTAELVAERSGYKGPIVQTPDLYHAFPEQIASVLGAVDDAHNRIMIVGHNPGLESLVAELSGRYEELPTAALVAIELPIAAWRNLEATGTSPTQVWRPRDL